jgi:hypothetical protein
MGLEMEREIKYIIEQQGDAYYLYSLVETNFGGVAKNFIQLASSEAELQRTIERLTQNERDI